MADLRWFEKKLKEPYVESAEHARNRQLAFGVREIDVARYMRPELLARPGRDDSGDAPA